MRRHRKAGIAEPLHRLPLTVGRTLRGGLLAFAAIFALAAAPSASAAELPQGRAYELVSSEKSNLGDVTQMASSDDGAAVEYMTSAGLESSRSAFFLPLSMAERSSSGWSTSAIEPVAPSITLGILKGGQLLAVSADMKKALLETYTAYDPADQDKGPDMYLLNEETGNATWITKPSEPHSTYSAFYFFAGGSRDLSTIYLLDSTASASEQLFAGMPSQSLYEWHEGTLQVVSREADGTPVQNAATAISPYAVSPYVYTSNGGTPAPHGGAHGVSDDGSTLFMLLSTKAGYGLFARRNDETIAVSASQKGSEGNVAFGTFIGASHDGDLAYFVSNSELTDTATEGGGLYSYRLPTNELELLTPDAGSSSGLGVSSAVMSDDASHVYFIATAALTPEAAAGEPNLYVYSGGETRFIETVPAGTSIERSSRSGEYALLESTGSIDGANNAGHTAIYRYDDQSGEIACVSCRPDGAATEGDSTLHDRIMLGFFGSNSNPRNIDDQGDVFFASSDKIVPKDQSAAWDVYEYTEGAPHLLTTGRSQYDSYTADNSDAGTDAFVITRSALLPSDQDPGLRDLYDARVGGGFPESSAEAPACSEDACQGEVPASSQAPVIGSNHLQFNSGPHRRYRLTAVKHRLEKHSAVLIARVTGPGVLSVRGRGLRPRTQGIKRGGTYRVRVSLQPWARKSLSRKGRLTVLATVTFEPGGGGAYERHVKLGFRK
ncbi:MAG: hypothetical protein ACM3Q9_01180 [Methanosarcina sp.]